MYDQYERKVIRLAKFIYRLIKHRIILLTLLTVSVVSSTGLVATKGIMRDRHTLSSPYKYGETLIYQSSSFLGEPDYEFSLANQEEWKQTIPRMVGEYKMRSRGRNNFGSYYYGSVQYFDIVPKIITVSVRETNLVYGQNSTIQITDQLVFGDQLEPSYTFTIFNKTTSTWSIKPNRESLKITNVEGTDVTHCYQLDVIEQEVQIMKRSLTILTGSLSSIYDDQFIFDQRHELINGTLVSGDQIELIRDTKVMYPGQVANELGFRIIDRNGDEMTLHYDITLQMGRLSVEKRPIAFSSASFEYTYDGENKDFLTSAIIMADNEQLLEGHEVVYQITNEEPYIAAGEYLNSFAVTIFDGETDVTNRYELNLTLGTTIIHRRKIEIETPSVSKSYDGLDSKHDGIVIVSGSLAKKDIMTNQSKTSYINSGQYTNKPQVKITDSITEVDFTNSYEITTTNGTIVIAQVKLEITLIPIVHIYDGKEVTNQFKITAGELVGNDQLLVQKNKVAKYAGTYDNLDFAIDIYTDKGMINTHNYDITIVGQEEAIVISKRVLKITTTNQSKTYDTLSLIESLPDDAKLYEINEGTIVEGEYLDLTYNFDPISASEYSIQSSIKMFKQLGINQDVTKDEEVTNNYDIEITNGTFLINRRSITITTLDYEYEYNRQPFVENSPTLYEVSEGLVEGHTIKQFPLYSDAINVGNYPYVLEENGLIIVDEFQNDVTSNYLPVFINTGTLTILPRKIDIHVADSFKIYDGKPFSELNYEVTNLLDGDELFFSKQSTVTHVFDGRVSNPPDDSEITILSNLIEDVTNNYLVDHFMRGSIYIEPRPITLTSSSFTKTFDGQAIGQGEVIISGLGLAEGDEFTLLAIDSMSALHVIDSGRNDFEFSIINADGLNVIENYDITFNYGGIKILPLEITLGIEDTTVYYDGTNHMVSYDVESITRLTAYAYLIDGTLPQGYQIGANIVYPSGMKFADKYNHSGVNLRYSLNGVTIPSEYDSDFDVTINGGAFIIKAREISVQSASGKKEYDANVFDQTLTITNGSLAPGDTMVVAPVSGVKEIGENQVNPIGSITIVDQQGENVTSSYNITQIYGRVTIYEVY